MQVCEVVGHVWATKKEESLNGLKLMVVQSVLACQKEETPAFVAVDIVGAGIGEKVLVVSGSTARRAMGSDDAPVDAVVVGIIDSIEGGGNAAD